MTVSLQVLKRMSHIGRQLITLDSTVSAQIAPVLSPISVKFGNTPIVQHINLKGPMGTASMPIHEGLKVSMKEGTEEHTGTTISINLDEEKVEGYSKYCKKFVHAMWGTTTATLKRHVEGITEGHLVVVRLVGVGYKAFLQEDGIALRVGFTHDVVVPVPKEISVSIPNASKILLTCCNLQKVTQFAATLRSVRKPEPYKGKGIFVGNETIRLKTAKKKK